MIKKKSEYQKQHRNLIIQKKLGNLKFIISKSLKISKSTVRDVINRFNELKITERKPGTDKNLVIGTNSKSDVRKLCKTAYE